MFYSLRFVAHDALYFDNLLSSAVLAANRFVDFAELLNLCASVCKLLNRVLCLRDVLQASATFDLLRKCDALESKSNIRELR